MLTVPNFYRIETSSHDLSKYNRLIEEPLDNSGGRIKVGSGSGLGLTMNVDYLRRNALDGFDDRGVRA